MDAEIYETRGAYEKIGMSKSQGGEIEYFNKDTWIQRDICDKRPWPFEDKFGYQLKAGKNTVERISINKHYQ